MFKLLKTFGISKLDIFAIVLFILFWFCFLYYYVFYKNNELLKNGIKTKAVIYNVGKSPKGRPYFLYEYFVSNNKFEGLSYGPNGRELIGDTITVFYHKNDNSYSETAIDLFEYNSKERYKYINELKKN